MMKGLLHTRRTFLAAAHFYDLTVDSCLCFTDKTRPFSALSTRTEWTDNMRVTCAAFTREGVHEMSLTLNL